MRAWFGCRMLANKPLQRAALISAPPLNGSLGRPGTGATAKTSQWVPIGSGGLASGDGWL
jgi:hypothetical protein